MRIAFLSPGWPPSEYSNGIVTWISIIREQLVLLGHDVFVVAVSTGKTECEIGIYSVDHLDQKSLAARAGLRVKEKLFRGYRQYVQMPKDILSTLNRLIDEGGIDLFVMEESLGWCGAIAKKLSVPVVASLHGPWFLCRGDRMVTAADRRRIKAEGRGLKGVAAFTAPSEFTLVSVRRHYGLEHEQTAVIPNPVRPLQKTNHWALDKCDKNNILFVGRFDRLKGADIALNVFKNLARGNGELTLTFVGPDDGLHADNGRRLGWEDYVDVYLPPEIRNRVTYTGQIQPEEVAHLRRRSFITLSCSRFETFSYVVAEALSMGCPVVATKVGGIPEIIRDGSNGLLAESGDVDGMTSKVLSLLNDQKLAASLGLQGRQDCEHKYNAEKITLQLLDFYKGVIERYGAPYGSKGV